MKRRIISALAGIFAIAVFTGCQQPAQSSDSGSGTKSSDTEVKETNGFEGTSWKYTDESGDTWILRFTSETEGTLTIKHEGGGSDNIDVNYTAVSSNEAKLGYTYAGNYAKGYAEIVGSKLEATMSGSEMVFTKQ